MASGGVGAHLADREDVAVDLHAELLEQASRNRCDRDARRRLAGAGALEGRSNVVEAVLDRR